MPRPKRDVVGKTFGRLTVLRDDGQMRVLQGGKYGRAHEVKAGSSATVCSEGIRG